jgi:hypothetical protein
MKYFLKVIPIGLVMLVLLSACFSNTSKTIPSREDTTSLAVTQTTDENQKSMESATPHIRKILEKDKYSTHVSVESPNPAVEFRFSYPEFREPYKSINPIVKNFSLEKIPTDVKETDAYGWIYLDYQLERIDNKIISISFVQNLNKAIFISALNYDLDKNQELDFYDVFDLSDVLVNTMHGEYVIFDYYSDEEFLESNSGLSLEEYSYVKNHIDSLLNVETLEKKLSQKNQESDFCWLLTKESFVFVVQLGIYGSYRIEFPIKPLETFMKIDK